jgi:AbrB family looped-hinge helix DNA binding protein
MTVVTLTSKGQVTIPKEIRELLRLHSGDKIAFFVKSNGEMLFVVIVTFFASGILPKRRVSSLSPVLS